MNLTLNLAVINQSFNGVPAVEAGRCAPSQALMTCVLCNVSDRIKLNGRVLWNGERTSERPGAGVWYHLSSGKTRLHFPLRHKRIFRMNAHSLPAFPHLWNGRARAFYTLGTLAAAKRVHAA